MKDLKISQRLFWFGIVIVSLGAGALLGHPGEYAPTADGSYLTPDLVLEKLAPIGWLLTMTWTLFGTIKARVDNGVMDPGDILALVKTEEFWIAIAGLIGVVIELFNGRVLDEGTQTLIVNVGLGMATLLLRDYGTRQAGIQSYSVRAVTKLPDDVPPQEMWSKVSS